MTIDNLVSTILILILLHSDNLDPASMHDTSSGNKESTEAEITYQVSFWSYSCLLHL